MTDSKSSRQFQIGINAVLILVTLMVVLPFLLVFVSSITDENVLIRNGYSFFPEKISFYAYQYIIRQGDKILRAYGVTILATFLGTILNVAMSALMAYPLSVRTLPYRRGITFFIFFTMLFNGGLAFVVGRKGWLFCDTPAGAQASAMAYTMAEMAKANKVNVYHYLTFLFEHQPNDQMTDEELEQLAPWNENVKAEIQRWIECQKNQE